MPNQLTKSRLVVLLTLLFSTTTFAGPIPGEPVGLAFEAKQDPIAVSAWFEMKEGVRVGNIYVKAEMGLGYHTYSQTHPGPEIATSFEVPVSEQFQLVGAFQPARPAHVEMKEGRMAEHFDDEIIWSAPVVLNEGVDPTQLLILVKHRGQACNAQGCDRPRTTSLEADFRGFDPELVVRAPEEGFDPAVLATVAPEAPTKQVKVALTPEQIAAMAKLYDPSQKIKYETLDGSTGTGTFWAAMFGAFFGGMLLNLMPCVFPVLGLKVLGFVEQAGSEPAKIRMHGIAFAAGLIFSMWVLAGIILGIKAASGDSVIWGQQMSNPYFVGAMVIMLFVLGLNMAGVFEMGLFMTKAGGAKKHSGYVGSFLSGIITTLVATPCSGPFLGAAMGYTLSQSAPVAMLLFTVFGFGIAMPYLLLSFVPALINLLPRPGAWMETFKKLMAFTLFAAAAFFAKSFGAQTGVDGLAWFLMAVCVISLATFFYGKWSPAYIKSSKRYVWGWLVPILVAGAGFWVFYQAAQLKAPRVAVSQDRWEQWVPGSVEDALAKDQPVWVDYTADW